MFHPTMYEPPVEMDKTVEQIMSKLPEHLKKPRVGVVCGSGLSKLVNGLRDVVEIPYRDLHGFSDSTGKLCVFCYERYSYFVVAGHKSSLAFGLMGESGVPVVAMLGRVRYVFLQKIMERCSQTLCFGAASSIHMKGTSYQQWCILSGSLPGLVPRISSVSVRG